MHCGPDGVYLSALGAPDGGGPGGIFMLDHESFEPTGAWEKDRGPQQLMYDFWWHLGYDTAITSEWGTPNMVTTGLQPDLLLNGKYEHALHVWDLRRRTHRQTLDLGPQYQMPFELKAVPPLITDINLSMDDRTLYVSCWGTGELRQYDVSDPFNPRLTGSVRIGGIVDRTPHPAKHDRPLNGGPQMVEVSRDGRRVYFTNALYTPVDEQFYPDGIEGWLVKVDASPADGLDFDPDFLVEFDPGLHAHQVRLQGGDSSSDSFCYS